MLIMIQIGGTFTLDLQQYIDRMIKITILILTTYLLFQCTTAPTPLLGGPQTITNYSTPQFQNVLTFIYQKHPEVKDYKIANAQVQVVNGINYFVRFLGASNCNVDITVYTSVKGRRSITSYNTKQCNISSGQYVVQSNPSGTQFQNALDKALNDNPFTLRSDLLLTELQVTSSKYQFTFRKSLQPQDFPKSTADSAKNPIIAGGFTEVKDQSDYAGLLKSVYANYPLVNGYKIVGVQKQVLGTGTNYQVSLQNNTGSTIRYSAFKIYVDKSGSTSISVLLWINISKKDFNKISQASANSVKLHPELKGYTLRKATNIWPNEGLALRYNKGETSHEVYIYNVNGVPQNFFI